LSGGDDGGEYGTSLLTASGFSTTASGFSVTLYALLATDVLSLPLLISFMASDSDVDDLLLSFPLSVFRL